MKNKIINGLITNENSFWTEDDRSFLEEQAEKLGISIKEQFGDLALSSKSPLNLGERCTVFMETELVRNQQAGASTADLVAGLAYSIVRNYLNRVVGTRMIGKKIFFQPAADRIDVLGGGRRGDIGHALSMMPSSI